MKKGFDKISQEEDEDFIVGSPVIQRSVSVNEIIQHTTALDNAWKEISKICDKDPTPENMESYDMAYASYCTYLNRMYSPIV